MRSVSGTWHVWSADHTSEKAVTACDRLVKVGGWRESWDGRRWPGTKVCCECPWRERLVGLRSPGVVV